MTGLKQRARTVQDALAAGGFECHVVELPSSTRTAKEAARAIGCSVAEIAKSIAVAGELDPYIDEKGNLRGLLIQAESFPGWHDFGAFVSHLRFVRDHHHNITKVAAVSDSAILSVLPHVARHFVSADVRHFEFSERETALAWLRES